jgi:hypothetical protein
VQSIKINILEWLGHIRRMDESLLCRKLTFSQLESSRIKGKPKLRWLDNVLQDLKILKVTAWWKKAQLEGCYQGAQGSQRAVAPDKEIKWIYGRWKKSSRNCTRTVLSGFKPLRIARCFRCLPSDKIISFHKTKYVI